MNEPWGMIDRCDKLTDKMFRRVTAMWSEVTYAAIGTVAVILNCGLVCFAVIAISVHYLGYLNLYVAAAALIVATAAATGGIVYVTKDWRKAFLDVEEATQDVAEINDQLDAWMAERGRARGAAHPSPQGGVGTP